MSLLQNSNAVTPSGTYDYEHKYSKIQIHRGDIEMAYFLSKLMGINDSLIIRKSDENSVAIGVALFITAGYWFTSSTSFANPAVTLSRILTNTFTGIDPHSALYFISGQILGSLLAYFNFKIFEKY